MHIRLSFCGGGGGGSGSGNATAFTVLLVFDMCSAYVDLLFLHVLIVVRDKSPSTLCLKLLFLHLDNKIKMC